MNNFKFSVPDLKCFTNASCQPSFAEILNHIATKHWLQTLAGTTKHRHGNFCGRIQHSVNEKCKRSLSLHFERQLFNVLLSTRFAVIFVPVVLIDYLLKWFPSMNWKKFQTSLLVSIIINKNFQRVKTKSWHWSVFVQFSRNKFFIVVHHK